MATVGQRNLGGLGAGDQVVAQVLGDHPHQPGVLARIGIKRLHARQFGHPAG